MFFKIFVLYTMFSLLSPPSDVVQCVEGLVTESRMIEAGLTDIQSLDPTIRVQLAYATTDNFVGQNMYGSFDKAYFTHRFAEKIVRAQAELQKMHPGYSLLILDASRPQSVQKRMFDMVKGTAASAYVANGQRGGRHNYGVAADLTIVDETGTPLDMGTPFDYFGEAAHTDDEAHLKATGQITSEAYENRKLLRSVMSGAGLIVLPHEWWHYQEPVSMQQVRQNEKLLDF